MFIKKVLLSIIILTAVIAPLTAQSPETLAVLDFTTEAVSENDMRAIVEFLSTELFKIRKYTVIDVSQRETILNEMEFSMSGCSDDSCALEIGKMLSAELIVVGNLSKIGSRFLLSVKMLETETSKTMGTANGKYKDLDELIDGLNPIAVTLAVEEAKTRETENTGGAFIAFEPATAEPAEAEQEEADEAEIVAEDKPVEPEEVKEPEEPAPQREPIKIDKKLILPISLTAGGVAGIGVGTYFIIHLFNTSLPSYVTARTNYTEAKDLTGDEITALYNESETTYNTAIKDLVLGSAIGGAGIILTVAGIILFPPAEKEEAVSFSPVYGGKPGLAVRVSY